MYIGLEKNTPEITQMLKQAKYCLNCGRVLKYLTDPSKRDNKGYCSMSCRVAKPPKLAYAEMVFGRPVREVILEYLNRGLKVEAVAELIGIERTTLNRWNKRMNIKRVTKWV